MARHSGRWLLAFLTVLPLIGQPTASVSRLDLQMPLGGPLPPVTTFNVTTTGAWTASISTSDLFSVSPAQGTGNATLTITPVDWRPLGTYNANIVITAQGALLTVPATLKVLARLTPQFTYAQGPTGCQDATPGLPVGNAALCTVANQKPPGSFAPPDNGSSYVDPNFGTKVRMLAGPSALHGYSTPSPVSATNKYILLSINDVITVEELLTGKTVRKVSIGFEGVMWDGSNDNYLYAFSGATVVRLDVTTGATTTVADYSKGALRFTSIGSGGTGEITKDNWLSFYAPQERQMCSLDLNTISTYCGAVPAGVSIDYPTMAKGVDKVSGRRYVMGVVVSGPFLIYAVNVAQKRLDLVGRGPENVMMGGNRDGICDANEACINGSHSDTMEDAAGNEYLVLGLEAQTPCEYSMFSIQLNKGAQMGLPIEVGGGLKRLMQLFRCGGDKWSDYHAGCAKAAPVCVISITTEPFGETMNQNNPAAVPVSPYLGEILIIKDNGNEVRRLAKHRSIQYSNEEANGYWSTPRAAISEDAAFVVATSNFGTPNQRRVIVLDTGYAVPRLVAGDPVLNGGSYEPRVASGTLSILFGSNLSLCSSLTSPFPLSTSLCGTSLKVQGQDALIFSVTPSQVAFFLPRGLAPQTDASLTLTTDSIYGGDPVTVDGVIPASAMGTSGVALFAKSLPGAPANGALLFDAQWNQRALSPDDYAIAFAVGLGPTNPFVADGKPSPLAEPLARLALPPTLYINDMQQSLVYAGLVPGMSGVYQLVWVINKNTPIHSDYNWVWINDGSVESPRLLMDLLPAT
ncbi:MAG: hypothetical protein ABI824_00240 [Acidobacteriota bacterium]